MSPTEIDVLARTLWAEARGESIVGMKAVVSVIINRMKDRRWPDDASGVCQQKWQFSCWNDGDPNLPKLQAVWFDDQKFREAYAVAAMALAGLVDDRTEGANHYLNEHVLPKLPKWADKDKITCRIGHHTFYRL